MPPGCAQQTAEVWHNNPRFGYCREKVGTTLKEAGPVPAGLAAAAVLGWAACFLQWRRTRRLKQLLRLANITIAAQPDALQESKQNETAAETQIYSASANGQVSQLC